MKMIHFLSNYNTIAYILQCNYLSRPHTISVMVIFIEETSESAQQARTA